MFFLNYAPVGWTMFLRHATMGRTAFLWNAAFSWWTFFAELVFFLADFAFFLWTIQKCAFKTQRLRTAYAEQEECKNNKPLIFTWHEMRVSAAPGIQKQLTLCIVDRCHSWSMRTLYAWFCIHKPLYCPKTSLMPCEGVAFLVFRAIRALLPPDCVLNIRIDNKQYT